MTAAKKVPAAPGSAPGVAGRLGADASERSCSVDGCKNRYGQLGFCRRHYERWRAGDATLVPPPRYCKCCGLEVPIRKSKRDYCDIACWRAAHTYCRVSGCSNRARQDTLCAGHLGQQSRGEPLGDLVYETRRPKGASARRDRHGRKECAACREWLDGSSFGSARTTDGLASACLSCCRSARLLRQYGITIEEYDALVREQLGVCAVCRKPPAAKPLAVDHDHSCCPPGRACAKCRRELLCGNCNIALGLLRDREEAILSAIAYVSNYC